MYFDLFPSDPRLGRIALGRDLRAANHVHAQPRDDGESPLVHD